jgi:hypothetical protein
MPHKSRVAPREYTIDRPNRRKASSRTTKAVVILLLLVSIALMVVVGIGGWSKLVGAQAVLIAYVLVYLIMAFYVARWNRGVLPLAAALTIVLGIFAAVAGPAWFQRDRVAFASPESLLGGAGLDADLLGLLTLVIVPVQVLLLAFSMQGFRQSWNVEVEVYADEAHGGVDDGGRRGAVAASSA